MGGAGFAKGLRWFVTTLIQSCNEAYSVIQGVIGLKWFFIWLCGFRDSLVCFSACSMISPLNLYVSVIERSTCFPLAPHHLIVGVHYNISILFLPFFSSFLRCNQALAAVKLPLNNFPWSWNDEMSNGVFILAQCPMTHWSLFVLFTCGALVQVCLITRMRSFIGSLLANV